MAETDTVSAMAEVLRPFLRRREKVFLCSFPNSRCAFIQQAEQAVAQLGGECICWSGQKNWQSLLRQVFSQRATVLIGAPRLILGLAKVAKLTATPLQVRHVVLLDAGEQAWLTRGIQESLDAQIHHFSCDALVPCLHKDSDPMVRELEAQLLSWSSVLDFRVERTAQGLRLEILVFPGRKLPNLPSGACVTVRPWNPKLDAPFCLCDS